ncbi:Fur family transcriptional regulator [Tersicoccus sp. Bi-70]|uniref:Fur family transcriptional regulator n=1 Tax=Tersicoccus sp. Bi-70 TaxID=1897634 RepID=UPI0009788157|nr:Fur family transcriptional regulator [Tersicoccus sp. Bi-70]OMH34887.1 transcriptional repressor [Tersicoccus sp. Bi-70]
METTATTNTEPDWPAQLRAHALRVTRPRTNVLRVVQEHPHASADEVHRQVRAALPEISVQSVYVVLADLDRHGLIRRIDVPASPARYETRTGDNHHHAQCVRCHRIVDVDCVVGSAPCLTPGDAAGMTILSADVLFRVVCADCRENGPDSGIPHR